VQKAKLAGQPAAQEEAAKKGEEKGRTDDSGLAKALAKGQVQ